MRDAAAERGLRRMQGPNEDRGGRRSAATTRRILLGRVVKLCLDNGFGFIRGAGGVMTYFDAGDALDFNSLRVGSRVRFELDPFASQHAVGIRAT